MTLFRAVGANVTPALSMKNGKLHRLSAARLTSTGPTKLLFAIHWADCGQS